MMNGKDDHPNFSSLSYHICKDDEDFGVTKSQRTGNKAAEFHSPFTPQSKVWAEIDEKEMSCELGLIKPGKYPGVVIGVIYNQFTGIIRYGVLYYEQDGENFTFLPGEFLSLRSEKVSRDGAARIFNECLT